MSESYIQKLFAERIGGENSGKSTAIYKFEKIKRAKRAALTDIPHRKLIDFGIGENDEMAPESPPPRSSTRSGPSRPMPCCPPPSSTPAT